MADDLLFWTFTAKDHGMYDKPAKVRQQHRYSVCVIFELGGVKQFKEVFEKLLESCDQHHRKI